MGDLGKNLRKKYLEPDGTDPYADLKDEELEYNWLKNNPNSARGLAAATPTVAERFKSEQTKKATPAPGTPSDDLYGNTIGQAFKDVETDAQENVKAGNTFYDVLQKINYGGVDTNQLAAEATDLNAPKRTSLVDQAKNFGSTALDIFSGEAMRKQFAKPAPVAVSPDPMKAGAPVDVDPIKAAKDTAAEGLRQRLGSLATTINNDPKLTPEQKIARIEQVTTEQHAAYWGRDIAGSLATARRVVAQTFKETGDANAAIAAGQETARRHIEMLKQRELSNKVGAEAEAASQTYDSFLTTLTDSREAGRTALTTGLPMALAYATGAGQLAGATRLAIQLYGSTAINAAIQQAYDGKVDWNDAVLSAGTEAADIPTADIMRAFSKGGAAGIGAGVAKKGIAGLASRIAGQAAAPVVGAVAEMPNEMFQTAMETVIKEHRLPTGMEMGVTAAQSGMMGGAMPTGLRMAETGVGKVLARLNKPVATEGADDPALTGMRVTTAGVRPSEEEVGTTSGGQGLGQAGRIAAAETAGGYLGNLVGAILGPGGSFIGRGVGSRLARKAVTPRGATPSAAYIPGGALAEEELNFGTVFDPTQEGQGLLPGAQVGGRTNMREPGTDGNGDFGRPLSAEELDQTVSAFSQMPGAQVGGRTDVAAVDPTVPVEAAPAQAPLDPIEEAKKEATRLSLENRQRAEQLRARKLAAQEAELDRKEAEAAAKAAAAAAPAAGPTDPNALTPEAAAAAVAAQDPFQNQPNMTLEQTAAALRQASAQSKFPLSEEEQAQLLSMIAPEMRGVPPGAPEALAGDIAAADPFQNAQNTPAGDVGRTMTEAGVPVPPESKGRAAAKALGLTDEEIDNLHYHPTYEREFDKFKAGEMTVRRKNKQTGNVEDVKLEPTPENAAQGRAIALGYAQKDFIAEKAAKKQGDQAGAIKGEPTNQTPEEVMDQIVSEMNGNTGAIRARLVKNGVDRAVFEPLLRDALQRRKSKKPAKPAKVEPANNQSEVDATHEAMLADDLVSKYGKNVGALRAAARKAGLSAKVVDAALAKRKGPIEGQFANLDEDGKIVDTPIVKGDMSRGLKGLPVDVLKKLRGDVERAVENETDPVDAARLQGDLQEIDAAIQEAPEAPPEPPKPAPKPTKKSRKKASEKPQEAAGEPPAATEGKDEGRPASRPAGTKRTAEEVAQIKAFLDSGDYKKAADLARATASTPLDRKTPDGWKIGYVDESGAMITGIDDDGMVSRLKPTPKKANESTFRPGTKKQYSGRPMLPSDVRQKRQEAAKRIREEMVANGEMTPDGELTEKGKQASRDRGKTKYSGRFQEQRSKPHESLIWANRDVPGQRYKAVVQYRMYGPNAKGEYTVAISGDVEGGQGIKPITSFKAPSAEAARTAAKEHFQANYKQDGFTAKTMNVQMQMVPDTRYSAMEDKMADVKGQKPVGPNTANKELLRLLTAGQKRVPNPEIPSNLGMKERTAPDPRTKRPFADDWMDVEDVKKAQPISKGEKYSAKLTTNEKGNYVLPGGFEIDVTGANGKATLNGPNGERMSVRLNGPVVEMWRINKGDADNSATSMNALREFAKATGATSVLLAGSNKPGASQGSVTKDAKNMRDRLEARGEGRWLDNGQFELDIEESAISDLVENAPKRFSLKTLKKSLPRRLAERLYMDEESGMYTIDTPRGQIRINPVGQIEIDYEALAENYSPEEVQAAKDGKLKIEGSKTVIDGKVLIELVEKGALPHELMHVFLDHFATDAERKVLDKRFADAAQRLNKDVEEVIADAYREFFEKQEADPGWKPKGPIGRFVKNVYDFFKSAYETFNPNEDTTTNKIFGKVREGGVYGRKAGEMYQQDMGWDGKTVYGGKRDTRPFKSNVNAPTLVAGGSAGKNIPTSEPIDPSFTVKATPKEPIRILMPDGSVLRMPERGVARLMGVPDDYELPANNALARTILGNGVPPPLMRSVVQPMLEGIKPKDGKSIKGVSLFSGGGIAEAMLKQFIKFVGAVEYNSAIADHYRKVNGDHIVNDDVRNVDFSQWEGADYLHASPVCKNFSSAKAQAGEVELDIETAKATARAIKEIGPQVVTVENVPKYMDSEAMDIIKDALEEAGYTYDVNVFDAADYGVPQHRQRMLLRATKQESLPPLPKKQPKVGWWDATKDLAMDPDKSGLAGWQKNRLGKKGKITLEEAVTKYSAGPRPPGSALGQQLKTAAGTKGAKPVGKGAIYTQKQDMSPRIGQKATVARAAFNEAGIDTRDIPAHTKTLTAKMTAPLPKYSLGTYHGDASRDLDSGREAYIKQARAAGVPEADIKRGLKAADFAAELEALKPGMLPKDYLILMSGKQSTSVRPNADFGRSVDFDTNCPRAVNANALTDAIENRLVSIGDKKGILSGAERVGLQLLLKVRGLVPECTYCYAFQGRNWAADFASRITKEPFTLAGVKWQPIDAKYLKMSDAEIATLSKEEQIHVAAAKRYIGGAKANIVKPFTPYRGEWLKEKAADVKARGDNWGTRLNSNTDFKPYHALDLIQLINDASTVGEKMHVYTKELDMLLGFGETGIKFNLSLSASGDGKGGLMFDAKEGMDPELAKWAYKNYKNAGGMLMATNTSAIIAGMRPENDWIGQIIPHHAKRLSKADLKALGWENFTGVQHDRKLTPAERKPGQKIAKKGDKVYRAEHKDDLETFLAACEEKGLRPRFASFIYDMPKRKIIRDGDGNPIRRWTGAMGLINTSKLMKDAGVKGWDDPVAVQKYGEQMEQGYMKMVRDFARVDTPFEGVKPNYNLKHIERTLLDWQKEGVGAEEVPVDDDIIEEFIKLRQDGKLPKLGSRADFALREPPPRPGRQDVTMAERSGAAPAPYSEKPKYSLTGNLGKKWKFTEEQVAANAGRTAKTRVTTEGRSSHAASLVDLLQGKSVIDWGSGKGDDMKFYKESGASSVQGYDPNHNPTLPEGMSDIVTNTFVGNVLPPDMRRRMWVAAMARAKDSLYVGVRSDAPKANSKVQHEPIFDGMLMGTPPADGGLGVRTFQKYYKQDELVKELQSIFPGHIVTPGKLKNGSIVTAVVTRKKSGTPPKGVRSLEYGFGQGVRQRNTKYSARESGSGPKAQ